MADLTGPNPDEVNGDTAHGSTDAGNPVKVGGVANSGLPTAVTNGQRVNGWLGLNGQLMTSLGFIVGSSDAFGSVIYAQNPQGTGGILSELAHGFNGTTFDRLRTITALDAAPNVDTGVLAVGIGPGWDRKTNPTGIVATSTSNAVTVVTDGADTMVFTFTTIGTTPGSMIIETLGGDAADTTLWATAGSVIKLGAETWVNGAFVPAVGDSYLVRTTGLRQVRLRVNAAYASGTVTVKVTGANGAAILKAMDLAPAPHNIGYSVLSAAARYTATQTSTNVVAGTTGQRIYVTSLSIATGGTTAVRVSVYWGTGAFTSGTSPTLFDGEFAPSATVRPGMAQSFPNPPGASSATGDNLRVTTDAAGTVYVTISYYKA